MWLRAGCPKYVKVAQNLSDKPLKAVWDAILMVITVWFRGSHSCVALGV